MSVRNVEELSDIEEALPKVPPDAYLIPRMAVIRAGEIQGAS